jgi:hypothetical protein
MRSSSLLIFSIIVIASLNAHTANAQQDSAKNLPHALSTSIVPVPHKQSAKNFPHAVLVELRAERNRINALEKDHRLRDAQEVQKDALGERSAMIKDFEINFNYCPVYYFIDTNVQQILDQNFEGVLLNADGSNATNIIVKKGSKDYVIASYGYISTRYQKRMNKEDSLAQTLDAEVPFGRGLIISNYKHQEVNYFYKEGYENIFFSHSLKKKQKGLGIAYESKRFDIEYFPFVKLFNKELVDPVKGFEFGKNYSLYNK